MHDTTSDGQPSAVAPAPPLGRFYQAGGRQLFVHRAGSGGPAVVFLPGGGAVGLDYWNVAQQAAEFTTSVVYDRAGTGWSERTDLRRTLAQVIDELREVLRAAAVPAPYVLVGHSLGGLYARYYATRFPAEVAGLVLLDPAHEEYTAHMPQELADQREAWDPEQAAAIFDDVPEELIQFYRGLFADEMADWPAAIREPLIDGHVSPEWLAVGFREAGNVKRLYDEIRLAGPLPDVPLIVLSSMQVDAFKRAVSGGTPESLLRAEIEGKWRLYAQLAASVPGGEIRPVEAGHVTIHLRHPEAVRQAIHDLIGPR